MDQSFDAAELIGREACVPIASGRGSPQTYPALSVILPVRNGGSFLPAALESTLAQTFGDFEVLAIDDGSSDGSRQYLEACAARDRRIRVLSNPGRGLVAALNHGILAARGDLIARMDADDISYPERFERQVAYLRAHPQVAAVGTQARIIDARGRPTGAHSNLPCDPSEVERTLITRGCALKHPSVLMRRDAIVDTGLYRPAVEHAEDFDLWLRLAESHSLANLPEVLLDYRQHEAQVSHDGNLEQKFAHGAALISAVRRRAGGIDPLNGGPSWSNQRAATTDLDLSHLARAYQTLKALLDGHERRQPGDLEAVIDTIRHHKIGGSKRFRVRALLRVARAAAADRCWRSAMAALMLALRTAPGRTLGEVARLMTAEQLSDRE